VAAALKALGTPPISRETRTYMTGVAALLPGATRRNGPPPRLRAMRANALRHLLLTCPDYQTC
jgi:hypothetical protein